MIPVFVCVSIRRYFLFHTARSDRVFIPNQLGPQAQTRKVNSGDSDLLANWRFIS
jgi:hypothetical protein